MRNFERHLFISYAHIDNQPLTAEQTGWISRFHATLEALLSMRLGQAAKIWRDDKLKGNDVFTEEIVDQFKQTAVLVSVLTPRYLNSEWCTREVREFCQRAETNGGVIVENKARVFKVLKAPVDTQESLPAVVKDVLGYEFFTLEDGAPLELDPAYGERFAQDYNRKVGKLAWDVAQLVKKLEAGGDAGPEGPAPGAPARPTIYLAECSYDLRNTREAVEGDLRRHGYTVLPDQELPRDQAKYVEAIDRLLARCQLAVHLVGSGYGAVPDGPSQKSIAVLQNERAVEHSKRAGLPRVIWLPEGTQSDQASQQAFVEALHRDADVQFGADLITGDFEALRNSIHAALKKLETPRTEPPPEPTTARLIYLICDEKDRKATVPLRKYFRERALEVALPTFAGDATAVREAHQRLMTTCDAVMVFYGEGDESWKRTIEYELKKMPGYRAGRPVLARRTYLATPRTSDKDDLLDMEEPDLINGLDALSEEGLAAFALAVSSNGAMR